MADEQYQDEDRSGAKTLWLGDVQPEWTEEYVESLFSSLGQELEVKLIRDRHRGIVAGYGFIDFRNHETAKLVLETLNGKPIEGTSLRYRLNWGAGGKRIEQAPEYSVFVGDLSPEVTDKALSATFAEKYSSVLGAKVVTNPMTGSSKSFGFIRFADEKERDDALTAMNGAECCGRPIRVAPATKRTSVQGQTGAHATDPSNTTVFVGGINDSVTEKVLRDTFSCAGEILTVTTPPGRGCAFVTFAHRASAEHVINNMQGTTVCGSCVRLSWGKSGRADRDRERDRAGDLHGGGGGIVGGLGHHTSPNAAAAAAAAAARGSQFSGLYGHPQSFASYNGAYAANLFPGGAVYGGGYLQPGQQQQQQQQQPQAGLPAVGAAGTGQLPQQQHQQAAAAAAQQQQQVQQQAAQQQQQYAQQPYSQQSYAPYQGFGFQQYPGQQQAAYTSFAAGNAAYTDPSALANDLSQLNLSGGTASAVGGASGGGGGAGGGRASRSGSRSGGGGGGGMYGAASRAGPGQGQGHGQSFSLQDVRKGGLGSGSRN